MENNIIFHLDKWIDSSTGEFLDNGYGCGSPRNKLASELCRWAEKTFNVYVPYCISRCEKMFDNINDFLNIRFSYCKPKTEKLVHPGIGDPERKEKDYNSRDIREKVTSLVLGKFTPSFKGDYNIGTITLYTKNIAEFSQYNKTNNTIDYDVVFWSTFVHELFHALHFSLFFENDCRNRWKETGFRVNRSIAVESLAAYAQYDFLEKLAQVDRHYSDEANKMMRLSEQEWRDYDIEDWYYSGALGIKHSFDDNPIEIIYYLLNLSIKDWKTAADMLKTGYYLSDRNIRRNFR